MSSSCVCPLSMYVVCMSVRVYVPPCVCPSMCILHMYVPSACTLCVCPSVPCVCPLHVYFVRISVYVSSGYVSLFLLFFIILIRVLCLCATLWVMIDLPPAFYIYVWPEAPYFITVSAFSRRNLFVTFGIPLLNPNHSFTV